MSTHPHIDTGASQDAFGRLTIRRQPMPACIDRHGRLTLSPQISWMTISGSGEAAAKLN